MVRTYLKSNAQLQRAGAIRYLGRMLMVVVLLGWGMAWAQLPPGVPTEDRGLFGEERSGIAATTDITLDFMLQKGSLLTGKVEDPNGDGFVTGSVIAQSMMMEYGDSIGFEIDPTSPLGVAFKYRIVLPDGVYNLLVDTVSFDAESESTSAAFIQQELPGTVTVMGDTVHDITVPALPALFPVTGTVTPSMTLPAKGLIFFQGVDNSVRASGDIASNGTTFTYGVNVPAGTYDIYVSPELVDPTLPPSPAEDFPFINIRVTQVTVNAAQVVNIALPETVNLSGRVQNAQGMTVTPVTVFAIAFEEPLVLPPGTPPPETPPTEIQQAICQTGSVAQPFSLIASGSSTLDEGNTDGMYQFPLIPETYNFAASVEVVLGEPAVGPAPPESPGSPEGVDGSLTIPFPPETVVVAADVVKNVIVPNPQIERTISGTVRDDRGQPVANASVSATSSMLTEAPGVLFLIDTMTKEDGTYQLPVYSGVEYTVTVCPPEPRGFSLFSATANMDLSQPVQQLMQQR